MSTTNLTPKQKETYDLLVQFYDGFLRPHRTMSDTFCYRLLDYDRNPQSNIQERWVKELIDLGLLIYDKTSNTFSLKPIAEEVKKEADITHLGINRDSFSKAS